MLYSDENYLLLRNSTQRVVDQVRVHRDEERLRSILDSISKEDDHDSTRISELKDTIEKLSAGAVLDEAFKVNAEKELRSRLKDSMLSKRISEIKATIDYFENLSVGDVLDEERCKANAEKELRSRLEDSMLSKRISELKDTIEKLSTGAVLDEAFKVNAEKELRSRLEDSMLSKRISELKATIDSFENASIGTFAMAAHSISQLRIVAMENYSQFIYKPTCSTQEKEAAYTAYEKENAFADELDKQLRRNETL